MAHTPTWRLVASGLLLVVSACGESRRSSTDSATGAIEPGVVGALSVTDLDVGRHVDAGRKISDESDEFAPSDTIYASVRTSGMANDIPVVGRWTYQDGTIVNEETDSVTTTGDARTVFFIAKQSGLPRGTYTLHVLVDGREARSREVTVQ